jgi:hypothetical protein
MFSDALPDERGGIDEQKVPWSEEYLEYTNKELI